MKPYNRFFTSSIRRRVTVTFLIITVLVISMAVISFLQLRQVQPFSAQIIRKSSDLVQLQRLTAATAALDADLERYLVIRGGEYLDSVMQDIQEIEDALTQLQNNSSEGENPELLELETTITSLKEEVQNVLDAVAADASSGEITRNIVAVYQELDHLVSLQQDLTGQTLTTLQSTALAQSQIADNVVRQSIILGVIVVIITIAATISTDRRLATINTLTNTATAIAEGDLTQVAPVESRDEIGTLAIAFNTMTSQLRETLEGLEARVEERTRALETSAEVSRRLSTILDPDVLVIEVVEQLRSALGYYHAHIYLFDDRNQNLVMVGGTGDAGRTMLAQGHKIEPGRGLVGQAAEKNQVVLIPDVSQAEGWLPNPLLPETKAEVAVPMAVGPNVMGVLDVQHNVVNGLTAEDAELIQAIANQVAVAVRNAQAYEQAQREANQQAQVTAISQRIQSATTIEEVLQIAVSELGQVLDAERSDVELSMIQKSNGRAKAS